MGWAEIEKSKEGLKQAMENKIFTTNTWPGGWGYDN